MFERIEESLSHRKLKTAEEEAERVTIEPRYLWGLSNEVKIVSSKRVKQIGLGDPEIMKREQHLEG